MLTLLGVLAVVSLPVATVVGLLLLTARVERARARRTAWQVAVTNAIHREMGAVVAPTVTKRLGRACQLVLRVPFERPALVGRVLAIARRALVAFAGPAADRVQIVLLPQCEIVSRDVERLLALGRWPARTLHSGPRPEATATASGRLPRRRVDRSRQEKGGRLEEHSAESAVGA